MPGKKLVEKYGNPYLEWGYYPISADYNSGGCVGNCGAAQIATDADAARGAANDMAMVQRGGNNAFNFRQHPGYTQHVVGTGCYNPKCHCYNCQGDCVCDDQYNFVAHSPRDPIQAIQGFTEGVEHAFTWIGFIAIAYFAYKLLFKKR